MKPWMKTVLCAGVLCVIGITALQAQNVIQGNVNHVAAEKEHLNWIPTLDDYMIVITAEVSVTHTSGGPWELSPAEITFRTDPEAEVLEFNSWRISVTNGQPQTTVYTLELLLKPYQWPTSPKEYNFTVRSWYDGNYDVEIPVSVVYTP